MQQDVFIIGATGKVGRELVSQILTKDTSNFVHPDTGLRHANPTRIVGLASSTTFMYNARGINDKQAMAFAHRRIEGKPFGAPSELLRGVGGETTFVDVTAVGKEMLDLHMEVISSTPHRIVTANKLPLTICDLPTFQTLTNRTNRYGFRSSVMAGAQAVTELQDLRDVGDEVMSIRGAFSGTLGHISTALEEGALLCAAVMDAKRKGYTEPHPAQDLDGSDVARKALILARTAGLDLGMDDIKLEPFIPKSYLSEPDVEKFLWSLRDLDATFHQSSNEGGMVLRYIAAISFGNTPAIDVKSVMLDKDDEFAMLKGTANMITIVSGTYSESYSIRAPGAGVGRTAQNIRRDLLYQLERRETNPQP